jgi:hypothetical protein
MQIDFHHAVTYVAARLAGFAHDAADIVAYAAQYVDDATSSGVVCFDNRAMYFRISSAHKMLDPDNLSDPENHLTWLPFHFVPGNAGLPAEQNPAGSFIEKIICRPDSPVARDMVDAAIADKNKPYSLHRLGITMHVYADTFAHQGFAGVLHEVNDVVDAHDLGDSGVFGASLWEFLDAKVAANLPPIGHARAGVLPDMPFLNWQYTNGAGVTITRNNTDIFCDAATAICKAMQRYRNVPPSGINPADMQIIRELFAARPAEQDGEIRHQRWLAAIESGRFSFGAATITYTDDGKGSWKADALSSSTDLPVHPYPPRFLHSNWKLFHDALQQHRTTLLHDILTHYGICAG